MRCLGCQYDLKNLTEHRCPECGRAFDPNDADTFDTGELVTPAEALQRGATTLNRAALDVVNLFRWVLICIVFLLPIVWVLWRFVFAPEFVKN